MKKIVVYYSLEGNIAAAAKKIAEECGADLAEIQTVKKVPLDFRKFFVGGYQAVAGRCPAIKPLKIDWRQYDVVILGTPVWADKGAAAINTFLRDYAVTDKIFAVFTTSGSGNNEKCLASLRTKLPKVRITTSLVDQKNPKASENEAKIQDFSAKILNAE